MSITPLHCWGPRGPHFLEQAHMAVVPLHMIRITKEEIVDMLDMVQVGGGHSFECFWQDSDEPWSFAFFIF